MTTQENPAADAEARAERRENHKLVLEYLKFVISLGLLATIVFAGLQWREANRVADHNVYQRITSDWIDHLRILVDKPDLRPYLEDKMELRDSDSKRNQVLAFADLRLNIIDAMNVYGYQRWQGLDAYSLWRPFFEQAFQTSPVLCVRARETEALWGPTLNEIAKKACTTVVPQSS